MGSRVGKRVGLLGFFVMSGALLLARPATAQEHQQLSGLGFDNIGGGIFIGYAFGAERGLEWGVEAFATRYFKDPPSCGGNDFQRAGFGPLLRFAMLNVSRPALTAAVHGGGEAIRSWLAFDAELGGTLAYSHDQMLGAVNTGLTVESLYFNGYARQQWLMSPGAGSVGGGVRVQPTYGWPGFCETEDGVVVD